MTPPEADRKAALHTDAAPPAVRARALNTLTPLPNPQRTARSLLALLLVLLTSSLLFAGEPWEFDSPKQAARAQAENQHSTVLKVYQKAVKSLKRGETAKLDENLRRLRWCVQKDPKSGLKRDKLMRWKKIDYYPYYWLAHTFAQQGRWDLAYRCIRREDLKAFKASNSFKGAQKFLAAMNMVAARLRVAELAREALGWSRGPGKVRLAAPSPSQLALLDANSQVVASQPAAPWKQADNPSYAARVTDLAKELIAVYRVEISSRRKALEELSQPPWPALLGETTPLPSPAVCSGDGNDVSQVRERLLTCAQESEGAIGLAARKACEHATAVGAALPAWCAEGVVPAWREIAALGGATPPRAVAETPTPPPPPRPKPRQRKKKQKQAQPAPAVAPFAEQELTEEAAEPAGQTEKSAAASAQPSAPAPAPRNPAELLRRSFRLLEEEGSLDRVLRELREVDSDGVFPREGKSAALCRATFAYLLYLKAKTEPPGGEGSPHKGLARKWLLEEASEQMALARAIDPALALPEGVFPPDFRARWQERAPEEPNEAPPAQR